MRKIVPLLVAVALTLTVVACSSSGKSSDAKPATNKACVAAQDMTTTIAAIRKDPSTSATQSPKLKAAATAIAANPPPGYEDGAKAFAALLSTAADKLATATDSATVETDLAPVFTTGIKTGAIPKYTSYVIVTCQK